MAISDDRQRVMPSEEDRASGQVLDFKEAVKLTNPSNPKLKDEVKIYFPIFNYDILLSNLHLV